MARTIAIAPGRRIAETPYEDQVAVIHASIEREHARLLARVGGGRIVPLYHHLYNVMHSYLVMGALVGLWALVAGGFEWAMLAVPIHLSGDRGLFGNVYKPVSLPFEPAPSHPAPAAVAASRRAHDVRG